MLQSIRALQAKRRGVSNRYGSPVFNHSFGIIADSGGREYIEIRDTFPGARKYEPLDDVVLVNTEAVALEIEVNGLAYGFLPANTIVHISDQAVWGLALTNNAAAATSAGGVRATLQRAPLNADKVARGE